MGFKSNITQIEMEALPLGNFEGEIFIVDSKEAYRKAIPMLKGVRVFGFDTETRPTFKKGETNKVSLLQLSTEHQAFLFRLHHTGLPKELRRILSSKKIIKTGAAIKDDIAQLQKISQFAPAGFLELQTYVENFGIKDKSLKKMAGITLGFRISKKQQTSNWENEQLTEAQIQYAANDAWVSFKIYQALNQVSIDED